MTAPDRMTIPHPGGGITVIDDYGHVIGWTERGSLGWSALWRSRAGDQRRFTDTPEAAAVLLRAGIAEEATR